MLIKGAAPPWLIAREIEPGKIESKPNIRKVADNLRKVSYLFKRVYNTPLRWYNL